MTPLDPLSQTDGTEPGSKMVVLSDMPDQLIAPVVHMIGGIVKGQSQYGTAIGL